MSAHCLIEPLEGEIAMSYWARCHQYLNEDRTSQIAQQVRHGAIVVQAFHWADESIVIVVRASIKLSNLSLFDIWRLTGPDRALRIELFETPQARAGWVNESNFKRGLPPLNLTL